MLKRLINLPRMFSRDERGQAMVITAILSFVLFRSVVMSYNVGVLVSQKIRAQTVADMASYSGAIWQARFLNYCAYTRRAILANYAQIAMMNSAIVNKRALDNIHNASEILLGFPLGDSGIVSDLLDILETVRDQVMPDDFGNVVPNFTDGREVADHMNYILAESQEGLFWSISPIELAIFQRIIDDCALQTGDLIQANLNHVLGGNSIPLIGGFPMTALINAGIFGQSLGIPDIPILGAQVGNPIIERRRIPLNEITPLFDFGMTLPSDIRLLRFPWPLHWGAGPLMGRPFISGDPSMPSCNNCIQGWFIRLVITFPEDTSMTDTVVRSNEHTLLPLIPFPIPDLVGLYEIMPFLCLICVGPITIPIPPPLPLPIFMYLDFPDTQSTTQQTTQPTPRETYRLKVPLDEVRVFEMRNGLQPQDLEPSVYAAVAQPLASTPYFRFTNGRHLGLLDEASDIVTVSRAKIYFKPPFENLNNRLGGRPNLHYPFWGAKLARLRDRRNGDILLHAARPLLSIQNLVDPPFISFQNQIRPNY